MRLLNTVVRTFTGRFCWLTRRWPMQAVFQQAHGAVDEASCGLVEVCIFKLLHECCGDTEEEVGLHITLQMPVLER